MENIFKIIVPLLYLVIPLLLSAKKRAKRGTQQRGETRKRQPVNGQSKSGNLMERFESFVKELEKVAQTREVAGGAKPTTGKSTEPAMHTDTRKYSDKASTAADIPEIGTGIPAWHVASTADAVFPTKDKRDGEKTPLFEKDDIIKGIILSEILQPPVALRRRNRDRPLRIR